ncbi:MAG: putative cytokinin oxidase [Labilithrix sp.]|nr:putative cytokinin oxidase [Labilithrix sp.]
MPRTMSRRNVLRTAVAGALVLGFDPVGRSWLAEASAALPPSCRRIPRLDGTLRVDPASLAAAADDFGHIVHRTPMAVLEPGSVQDIARMVRFARQHRLKIAMRGQGHTTYGQAQVEGGIVVDSTKLMGIQFKSGGRVVVGAGVLWADVVREAFTRGLTPPILTDYLGLSVGGTLALGGIGGQVSKVGAQVDNVLELDVVTGEGEIETCSPSRNRRLFEATLAGLGQCALIVRATLRLVPAKTHVTVFNLSYADIGTFVDDQRRLLAEGRFDYLEGNLVPDASGTGWRYVIEAATCYTPPQAPDTNALLAGISDDASARQSTDQSYLDFAFRIEPLVALLKSVGAWGLPHPWFSVFVPVSTVKDCIGDIVANLTLADTGGGPVLFYPFRTSLLRTPLLRTPNEDFFTFNLLRFAPPDPVGVDALIAQNRDFFDEAVLAGGVHYPLGSIPLSPADWRDHYGEVYDDFLRAKRRFDPGNVLTPGQGIFPDC